MCARASGKVRRAGVASGRAHWRMAQRVACARALPGQGREGAHHLLRRAKSRAPQVIGAVRRKPRRAAAARCGPRLPLWWAEEEEPAPLHRSAQEAGCARDPRAHAAARVGDRRVARARGECGAERAAECLLCLAAVRGGQPLQHAPACGAERAKRLPARARARAAGRTRRERAECLEGTCAHIGGGM